MGETTNQSDFLATTQLFNGSTPEEINSMLGCLGMYKKVYKAGEYVYRMGDTVQTVGLVLEGSVRLENVDTWGNVNLVGTRTAGQLFVESYAAVPEEPLMYNVVASEKSAIMFLNLHKVLATCSRACPNHARTSTNMTSIIARHNLELSLRIFHAAPRTIRGKVLAYLSYEAERAGSLEFDIPYNRQQLADYLGVDRSALSAELSRMQQAGLIETHRSHFVLKAGD